MPGIADQIRELSYWLQGTDIEHLELDLGNGIIRLRRETSGQSAAPFASAEAGTALFDVPAPCVGIFRRTHPLRTTPLVQAGQSVTAGDAVGLLQIGALLIYIVAPKNGTVSSVLVEDGAAVGYGTVLMRFRGSAEQ